MARWIFFGATLFAGFFECKRGQTYEAEQIMNALSFDNVLNLASNLTQHRRAIPVSHSPRASESPADLAGALRASDIHSMRGGSSSTKPQRSNRRPTSSDASQTLSMPRPDCEMP